QEHPGCKVWFLSHSAGSQVVLAAAENLPPESVERIVLLAPSVSADYDLRQALACARRGIDVFWRERDWWALGVGTGVVGTADRRWTEPAGRVGFRPVVCDDADAALYTRLRQYPWDPCVEWTGNRGGHYAAYQPTFLRFYVLPLLTD